VYDLNLNPPLNHNRHPTLITLKCTMGMMSADYRVLISLLSLGREPVGGNPLKSATHGQCDARLTVTFPAAGHHRRYQIILLGDRGTCVRITYPRSLADSGIARIRTSYKAYIQTLDNAHSSQAQCLNLRRCRAFGGKCPESRTESCMRARRADRSQQMTTTMQSDLSLEVRDLPRRPPPGAALY